ncbi:MAG: trypsin-like peptidase domain-containing protein [Planctomycetota bacterium]|nr:trypsin-like peptidase domain-containing protein [Planctomycetota bacterium]
MALPTTTLFGAMLVAGAATDLPLAAEKGATSNVVEVEGHRDFRQHFPEKPLGERVPVAVRTNLDFIPVPIVSLEALDHAQLMFEGEALEREGAPFRYGVPRKLEVLEADGMWINVPGGRIWQVVVHSTDAENLMVKVENMSLPEGAELRSYVQGLPETVNGPFTDQGPSKDDPGTFWTLIEAVDRVVIEYFEPGDAPRTPGLPFELTEVIHGYVPILKDGLAGSSGSCHNEATCYPDWADVGDATALVLFSGSLCSGQLIATSNQNQTAYYMTANHCISTNGTASSAQFIFKYERLGCTGQVFQGVAAYGSSIVGTQSSSDSTLLQINGSVPNSVFYVGWTTNSASINTPITCLHHPSGDRMKYSTGTIVNNPVCGSSLGWFGVVWNDGVTEGGSSGSGAYRTSDQKLMGVLTCGSSSCGNQNGLDGYGRFARAYSSGGFSEYLELGPPGDDPLDDNDDCNSASFLEAAGSYNDLIVKAKDEDWYRVTVPPFQTARFDLDFVDFNGDIDIELYALSCSGDLVAVGDTNTNDESVQWSNYEPGNKRVSARVFLYDGDQNDYDLDLSFTENPEPVGRCCASDTFCTNETQALCEAAGFTWGGFGTSCSENAAPCAPPSGACCVGGNCIPNLAQDTCASVGGQFAGVGSTSCLADCAVDEPCEGDIDGDDVVGGQDLAKVLANWQTPAGDLNGDLITDGQDLALVLANWGPCDG